MYFSWTSTACFFIWFTMYALGSLDEDIQPCRVVGQVMLNSTSAASSCQKLGWHSWCMPCCGSSPSRSESTGVVGTHSDDWSSGMGGPSLGSHSSGPTTTARRFVSTSSGSLGSARRTPCVLSLARFVGGHHHLAVSSRCQSDGRCSASSVMSSTEARPRGLANSVIVHCVSVVAYPAHVPPAPVVKRVSAARWWPQAKYCAAATPPNVGGFCHWMTLFSSMSSPDFSSRNQPKTASGRIWLNSSSSFSKYWLRLVRPRPLWPVPGIVAPQVPGPRVSPCPCCHWPCRFSASFRFLFRSLALRYVGALEPTTDGTPEPVRL